MTQIQTYIYKSILNVLMIRKKISNIYILEIVSLILCSNRELCVR